MQILIHNGFFTTSVSSPAVSFWLNGAFGHTQQQFESLSFLDVNIPKTTVELVKSFVGVHDNSILESRFERNNHPRNYLFPLVSDSVYYERALVIATLNTEK